MLYQKIVFTLKVFESASNSLIVFLHLCDFYVDNVVHFSSSKLIACHVELITSFLSFPDLQDEHCKSLVSIILQTLIHSVQVHGKDSEFIEMFYPQCLVKLVDHFVEFCFGKVPKEIPFSINQQLSVLYGKFLKCSKKSIKTQSQDLLKKIILDKDLSGLLAKNRVGDKRIAHNIQIDYSNKGHLELVLSLVLSLVNAINVEDKQNARELCLLLLNQILNDSFSYKLTVQSDQTVYELSAEICSHLLRKIINSSSDSLPKSIFSQLEAAIVSPQNDSHRQIVALKFLIFSLQALFAVQNQSFVKYFAFIFSLDVAGDKQMEQELMRFPDILYGDQLEEPTTTGNPVSVSIHKWLIEEQKKIENHHIYLFLVNLRFIPQSTLENDFGKILPIVLKGLAVNEYEQINEISLKFVSLTIEQNMSSIQNVIFSIVKSLILLSTQSERVKVRSSALKCLNTILDKCPENHLINFKTGLLKSLQPTLADRKRMVRSLAASAYCKMSMLGQPGTKKKSLA